MNIIKATDLSPKGAQFTVVLGPHGIGKSSFAATVMDVVPPQETLLIATLPREVKSWRYQEYNPDTVLVVEPDTWDPLNKQYKPTAFNELIGILDELVTDEKYGAVIIDNGTEAGEFAWHDSLAPLKIGDPGELGSGGNRFAPYVSIRERLENLILKTNRLTNPKACARPKHVIVPWHVQEPKDDESSKKDVEYAGKELPMIRGGFRRRLGQKIDVIVYAVRRITAGGSTIEHVIQIVSDMEKHCKMPCEVPSGMKYIDPRYEALLELI